MTALIGFYWYALLIAAGIGLLTGWWTWGYYPAAAPVEICPDDDLFDWPAGPEGDEGGAVGAPAEVADEADATTGTAEGAQADRLGPAIAAALPAARAKGTPAAQAPLPETVTMASPASTVASMGVPPVTPDDLLMIKGIGPQLDALLRSLGIQRFEDIAGWMPEDIERIDGQLGLFKGSILRDEWIGQARLLARGDMESFQQRYGHLS